jgi:hypothetical protein
MDLDRYLELRAILQQWRGRLAESIRRRIEGNARRLAQLQTVYQQEGADEAFTTWLDRWCRQAAIQYILRILFLRVLEDRDLLGVTRLRTTDGQRMWSQLTRNLGIAHYVQWCFWDAAHLLPDLFAPNGYDRVLPEDELVQRFLDDVWRRPDPNREGWLRFDFRPDPARQDVGFQTRFIGDLYQELDAEIRDRYALLQTPHFISQFILEQTLLKRFEEKDFRQVTLIDPTVGSGHFLVDAFWMFIARYEADRGVTRTEMTSGQRAEIARRVIERHLFGCDINPYATALARFRLLLAACDYAHPTSLHDFRDLRFNLVTIDSLIRYEQFMVEDLQEDSTITQVLGHPSAIKRALPVLRRNYDVVVGNPPYITAKNKTKRDLYRESYQSAYGSFGLAAPFIERFLQLAREGGVVGLISSNAFARRQFGKKLIEEVLPRYDLRAIVDLSGAYIPGHGTPTLLVFARHQQPSSDTVLVLSNLKGEPEVPSKPAKGKVWRAVINGYQSGHSYQDEYVDVFARPRDALSQHPWEFGGPASRLAERIRSETPLVLSDVVSSNGRDVHTGMNDIYISQPSFFRRLGVSTSSIRPCIRGENLRDWAVSGFEYLLFPYKVDDSQTTVRRWSEGSPEMRYLQEYHDVLAARRNYGKSIIELGLVWYEYGYISERDWDIVEGLAQAFIGTHVHFSPLLFNGVTLQSAPRLVPNDARVIALAGFLNSVVADFCLKQVSFDKRAGKDPVRDTYYEFASSNVDQIPLPDGYDEKSAGYHQVAVLAEEAAELASELSTSQMVKLFEEPGEAYQAWNSQLSGYFPPNPGLSASFANARELRATRDQLIALREEIRGRMIFLQEEIDWLAYEMYGLLKGRPPLAEDYLTPRQYREARLRLGQRPFEVAGKGYQGDWPAGYQPPPLPEVLESLTQARIRVMEANPDIDLLEDPLYKRRWIPPDYEAEFREAAEWWLAEKLEWALEQHGRPIPLREWAHQLGQDERVLATLEVLTGTPAFDLERELLRVIEANAVPNRPEHYLRPEGLRKLYAAQRSETPQTPEYLSREFSDRTAWSIRGKLNIPRERFIYYAEFDHTQRGVDAPDTGGPWFGWAGWDPVERAEALVYLLEQASRAGWEIQWRQCGLRAALRELLPQLDALDEADRAEFAAIAEMCGISLGTPCYCQAYRDAMAQGEPGVPQVDAEVLGVRVVMAEERKKKARQQQGRGTDTPQQLRLDME